MQIDEQREREIKDVFKVMLEYDTMNSENTSAKTETLNRLVASMSADKGERKDIATSLKKAYKEYKEEQQGKPDTLNDMLTFVRITCRGKDVE